MAQNGTNASGPTGKSAVLLSDVVVMPFSWSNIFRQRLTDQINAAFVFARSHFVNVHESVCLNLPASRRAACVLLVTN